MFTVDRLKRILELRGLETDTCRPHEVLDMLDDIAGIDSTGGLQYGVLSRRMVPINGVGARVAQHEQVLNVFRPPPLIDDTCFCSRCQG